MRHLKAGRKLGRNASHRLALMRNLSRALVIHERIITTEEKAKELRGFVERLITLAKKNTLHARRQVIAKLGPTASCQVLDEEETPTGATLVKKLFDELGPRFQDRPGGYTRIIKRPQRRLGDGGKTAFIELLKAGEVKVRAKAPAPARTEASLPVEPTTPAAPPPAPTAEATTTPAPTAATPENPPA